MCINLCRPGLDVKMSHSTQRLSKSQKAHSTWQGQLPQQRKASRSLACCGRACAIPVKIESHNRQTGNHNMFRKLKPEVASLLEPKTRTPDMKSAVAAAAAPPPHPPPLRSTKEAKPYKIKHLLRPGLRHGDGNPPAPRPVHKPGPETSDRTVTMAKTFVLNTTSCCFPSLLFPLSTST